MNGPPARGPASWKPRAASSLPLPDSPLMSRHSPVWAARPTRANTACVDGPAMRPRATSTTAPSYGRTSPQNRNTDWPMRSVRGLRAAPAGVLPAVDERAVPALEIAHHDPLAVELHLGVLARHPLVVEPLAAAVLASEVDLSRQERQRAQRGGARGVEEEETRTRR